MQKLWWFSFLQELQVLSQVTEPYCDKVQCSLRYSIKNSRAAERAVRCSCCAYWRMKMAVKTRLCLRRCLRDETSVAKTLHLLLKWFSLFFSERTSTYFVFLTFKGCYHGTIQLTLPPFSHHCPLLGLHWCRSPEAPVLRTNIDSSVFCLFSVWGPSLTDGDLWINTTVLKKSYNQ